MGITAEDLADAARGASDEAIELAAAVLRSDIESRAWREQLGPCLTQAGVATLLGISPQAVAKRAVAGDLLRLANADGRPAYPLVQFRGRQVIGGLDQVLELLGPVEDPLTVASWLTIPKPALDGRTPVAALAAGDSEEVVAAAADYLARST
ncbi:MAG: hypothetical protein ACR2JF_18270 [Iamia sp.]